MLRFTSRVDACNKPEMMKLNPCSAAPLVVTIICFFQKEKMSVVTSAIVVRAGLQCKGKSRMVIFLAELYPSGNGSSSQVRSGLRSMSDSLPESPVLPEPLRRRRRSAFALAGICRARRWGKKGRPPFRHPIAAPSHTTCIYYIYNFL